MLKRLIAYLVLPREITQFERAYLGRMNRVAGIFFALHVPLFAFVALINGTGAWLALGLTLLMVSGPMLAARVFENPRHLSMTYGFTSMGLGGLLVHFGQGPMQIEMHFYFFVLIALLAVFANPEVILVAAATVVAHHLVLWVALPSSVFNYEASFSTIIVHAIFVVLESAAACFVARSFFDNVIGLERIVNARTVEINARNAGFRLVFDTIGEGIVALDRQGRMSTEVSAALERWLGRPIPGENFSAYVGRHDAHVGSLFELGWDGTTRMSGPSSNSGGTP